MQTTTNKIQPMTMKNSSLHFCAIALIAIFSFAAFGCRPKAAPPAVPPATVLNATVAGRDVRAVIDGPGSVQNGAEGATFSFGTHKLIVGQTNVVMDGKEFCALIPKFKKVEITFHNGEVKVSNTEQ